MPRREHANLVKARAIGRHAEIVEEVVDAASIRHRAEHTGSEQALDLGCPEQPAVAFRVVKRTDTGTIAAEKQRARVAIPNGDRELARGLAEHRVAVLFIEMYPRFGIAMGGELMTAIEQVFSQLGVFVEFALEGGPDVAGFVRHRLTPAGDVDDCQAPRAECHAGFDVQVLIIRTAVSDRASHSQ